MYFNDKKFIIYRRQKLIESLMILYQICYNISNIIFDILNFLLFFVLRETRILDSNKSDIILNFVMWLRSHSISKFLQRASIDLIAPSMLVDISFLCFIKTMLTKLA